MLGGILKSAVCSGFGLEGCTSGITACGGVGRAYVDLLGGARMLAVVIYAILYVAAHTLKVVAISLTSACGLTSTVHIRHDGYLPFL